MSYKTANIDRTAYVSPTFADSDDTHKFSTIQAAIDYIYTAYGPITDDSDKAVVRVAPGKYIEQIHSYENIIITSYTSGYDSINTPPPATIYNTGVDAATYPLRSDEDEVYDLVGINVETAVSGTLGKLPFGNFNNCRFNNGHFIERNSNVLSIFGTCSFDGSSYGGFNLTGAGLTGYRNLLFRGECSFEGQGTPILTSTHTGFANFKWTAVDMSGSVNVGGDWDWRLDKCYIFGLANRNTFSTTGTIDIIGTTLINGIHFSSAPEQFKMVNSSFVGIGTNKIPDGEGDITADVTISGTVYSNNIQHNGIDGELHIINTQKNVGGDGLDGYRTLQEAIDSVDEKGIIKLFSDIESSDKLIITGSKEIAIEGDRQWKLGFSGDIIDLEANQVLYLNKFSQVTGGTVTISGSNAEFHIHTCPCGENVLEILADSGAGSKVHILDSSITGSSGHSVLQINNTDTTYMVCYSRLKGAAGQPAVEFTVEADNVLQARYSTFIHGDGEGNSPINRVGGYTVTTSTYLCAGNASLSPAGIANDITGNGNTNDPSIDF